MAMSKDRVRFDLPINSYSEGGKVGKYHALCLEVFGLDLPHLGPEVEKVEITCRPSQFARFLIRRNEMGIANAFKILNAELIPAPVEKQPAVLKFDTSKMPARWKDVQ